MDADIRYPFRETTNKDAALCENMHDKYSDESKRRRFVKAGAAFYLLNPSLRVVDGCLFVDE